MKKLIILLVAGLPFIGLSQPVGTTTTTTTGAPTQTTTATGGSNPSGIMNAPSMYPNDIVENLARPLRKPIPYVPLREADVMWKKRIWRIIDIREKMNEPLYYPTDDVSKRPSFFTIIKNGIQNQEFEVFDATPSMFTADEEFRVVLPYAAAQKVFIREINIMKQDTITGDLTPTTIPDTLGSDDVAQYWVKEDMFFDKQRSILDVRILGIAPVVEKVDDKGEFKAYVPLFWLYYPACRNYFAKYECFNPYNDAEWRSFDEIFHKRMFTSYIKQETNVYNRPIGAYKQGIDALLEAEEIKDNIFKFEHDMWHF